MNSQLLHSIIAFLFLSTSLMEAVPKLKLSSKISEASLVMCSNNTGRCTGSAYCTVCTNCSRCAYCNSGGTCGVCGKKPASYRLKKKKKKIVKQKKYNNKFYNATPVYKVTYKVEDLYILVGKTSLRIQSNSQSKVLRRLSINEEVQMLDGYSTKYWCKVIYKGEIGWVKKHLLQKR